MAEGSDKNRAKQSALDQWLSKSKKVVKDKGIQKMPENEPAVLSHGQERLWLLDQLYPNQNLYNYAHHYQIQGQVQVELLLESFQLLAQKHEILRSNYELVDAVVVQVVKHDAMPIQRTKLTHLSAAEQQVEIERQKKQFLVPSFDLANDSLFQLFVFELTENRYELFLLLHHIIGDAWSMDVINQELSKNYHALLSKQNTQSEDSPIQYKDYAYWQRKQAIKEADLKYWKEKLSGEIPQLDLPKQINSAQENFKGNSTITSLSSEISSQLKKLAKQFNTTPFVLLLGAYKVLLSKYSGQSDLLVASPFSNRDTKELEQLIGFFNETIVLRSQVEGNLSFSQFIETLKQATIEAFEHKNVPFDTLVNELKIEREAGENPLFQTMFLYNGKSKQLDLGEGIHIQEEMVDLAIAKFDLTLFVNEQNTHLELIFEHSSKFGVSFIENMSHHFVTLLENICKAPETNISTLSIFSKSAFNQMVYDWNDTAIDLPKVKSIQELIFQPEHQQKIALSFQDTSITYQELDDWSTQLALQLQAKGVSNNDFVGLYTHRSLEMIVGMMAILKSGGAYLPLDPDYPEERIYFMLSDTSAPFVLIHPELSEKFDQSSVETISIQPFSEEENTNDTLVTNDLLEQYAYIIYTSGSTGKPKGVPVTHQQVLHSTVARFHFYEDPLSSFLLLSSFSFDSSVAGIFWALTSGGKLVLPPQRMEQDVAQLSELIQKEQVTHSLLLPSLYQVLLQFTSVKKLNSLTTIMVAGEACSVSLRKEHFEKLPTVKLYNEYGPTEASVWCIAHQFRPENDDEKVPIGRPIPNAKAYILDASLHPVPVGVSGELYIGGRGITRGYLNRTELTEEKFLPNPFEEKERIYKTGDLASYRSNGLIDFLGRVDSQVKIRGHRVELEEIRALILQYQQVKEAVVLLHEANNSGSIVAYLECDSDQVVEAIRSSLKKQLPAYMVPSSFTVLKLLPKLPNGKIDSKQLPAPSLQSTDTREFVAASNETQEKLAQIWQEVLGIEQIGIHDNFFDIGGDSIRSIQVVAKASQENIQLKPTSILEHQTIAELSEALLDSSNEATWSSIVALKREGHQAPLFCIHSGGAHVLFYQALAKNMVADRPVYAIQPSGIDGEEAYHESIVEMATDYIAEMKKVQPNGPYHLIGTCFGNAVGLEMMHQLKSQNEEVAIFFVVDSAPAYLEPPSPNGERKPIRRMLSMLQEGNWNGIYKKFRNRYIRLNKKRTASKRNEQEIELDEIIDSLNDLYASYSWKPIHGNFVLIRSQEFAQRKDKKFHLERWQHLSHNQVKVEEIKGHHLTLFEEPEVKGLTQVMVSYLAKLR